MQHRAVASSTDHSSHSTRPGYINRLLTPFLKQSTGGNLFNDTEVAHVYGFFNIFLADA